MKTRRWMAGLNLGAAAVAAAMIFGPSAVGQDLPRSTLLSNMVRQPWLRFEVSSGHVVLKVNRGIQTSSSTGSGTRKERLTIRAAGADPALDYDLTTPDEEITIRFAAANRCEIRRTPKANLKVVAVEFIQPGTGPISLKIGQQDAREYRATTLWHLVLAEPTVCRESLLPLLGMLQPNWDLGKTADEIRAALLRMADAGNRPDHKQWAEWVKQLGDDQFSKREAADRQLREAGRTVVTYLRQLDPSRLDAEQQFRIRRIINALTASRGDDSPEQVASWLLGDPAVWLAILASEEESARKTAARQLGALLGGPIAFDPAADAGTRKKQIEALRGRIKDK